MPCRALRPRPGASLLARRDAGPAFGGAPGPPAAGLGTPSFHPLPSPHIRQHTLSRIFSLWPSNGSSCKVSFSSWTIPPPPPPQEALPLQLPSQCPRSLSPARTGPAVPPLGPSVPLPPNTVVLDGHCRFARLNLTSHRKLLRRRGWEGVLGGRTTRAWPGAPSSDGHCLSGSALCRCHLETIDFVLNLRFLSEVRAARPPVRKPSPDRSDSSAVFRMRSSGYSVTSSFADCLHSGSRVPGPVLDAGETAVKMAATSLPPEAGIRLPGSEGCQKEYRWGGQGQVGPRGWRGQSDGAGWAAVSVRCGTGAEAWMEWGLKPEEMWVRTLDGGTGGPEAGGCVLGWSSRRGRGGWG